MIGQQQRQPIEYGRVTSHTTGCTQQSAAVWQESERVHNESGDGSRRGTQCDIAVSSLLGRNKNFSSPRFKLTKATVTATRNSCDYWASLRFPKGCVTFSRARRFFNLALTATTAFERRVLHIQSTTDHKRISACTSSSIINTRAPYERR